MSVLNEGSQRNKTLRTWLAVGMLALFMLINFWDRSVLGLAGVPIMNEMRLSHAEFGLVGSAFFALFSISAIIVGWLGDRWSTKKLLAGMALVWAVAQAIPLAGMGFAAFLCSRILLGAGEGSAFPTALHAAYGWFPNARQPLITAVIASGAPLGVATSALFVTWIIALLGWREAFGILSAISLMWCITWWFTGGLPSAKTRVAAPTVTQRNRVSKSFFLTPTMIGVTAAAFAVYWVNSLAVIWFPPALEAGAGMTLGTAGIVLTVAWLVQVPTFLCSGWLSESLRRLGYSSEFARGSLGAAGVGVSGVAMIGFALTLTTGGWITAGFTAICLASTAVAITCVPPIVGELAGAAHRGKALGIWIAISATGGIVAPFAFGKIVDMTGSGPPGYRTAFLISGSLVIVLAIAAQSLTRPSQDFNSLAQRVAAE